MQQKLQANGIIRVISVILNDIEILFSLKCSSSDSTQTMLKQFSYKFTNKDMTTLLKF